MCYWKWCNILLLHLISAQVSDNTLVKQKQYQRQDDFHDLLIHFARIRITTICSQHSLNTESHCWSGSRYILCSRCTSVDYSMYQVKVMPCHCYDCQHVSHGEVLLSYMNSLCYHRKQLLESTSVVRIHHTKFRQGIPRLTHQDVWVHGRDQKHHDVHSHGKHQQMYVHQRPGREHVENGAQCMEYTPRALHSLSITAQLWLRYHSELYYAHEMIETCFESIHISFQPFYRHWKGRGMGKNGESDGIAAAFWHIKYLP